ncbi:MAG: hypothetical protein DGJ47_000970 [Rickettsiaceae bacterium]
MTEEIKKFIDPGKKNIIMIYVLYILGNITAILPLVGAVFAFVHMGHENILFRTHYQFAFRTFVLSLAATVLLFVLSTIMLFISPALNFISMLLYVGIFVWFVLRSIFAIRFIMEDQAHPNPMTLSVK